MGVGAGAVTRRAGFTLIEVVLAIALMMALLTALFVFLRGSERTQESARAAATRQLEARALCDMIERDLFCCTAGNAADGPGVAGSATELRILARGVSPALASQGVDDPRSMADLERAVYAFDADAAELSVTRTLQQPGASHVETRTRRQASNVSSERTRASEAESLRHIARLEFRYFDGSAWQRQFDSLEANRLPLAVEISLWLHPRAQAEDDELLDDPQDDFAANDSDNRATAAREEGGDETFDALDVDESAEREEWPAPDVVRVIVIPDAGGGSPAADDALAPDRGAGS